jgi:hypothetical protein
MILCWDVCLLRRSAIDLCHQGLDVDLSYFSSRFVVYFELRYKFRILSSHTAVLLNDDIRSVSS